MINSHSTVVIVNEDKKYEKLYNCIKKDSKKMELKHYDKDIPSRAGLCVWVFKNPKTIFENKFASDIFQEPIIGNVIICRSNSTQGVTIRELENFLKPKSPWVTMASKITTNDFITKPTLIRQENSLIYHETEEIEDFYDEYSDNYSDLDDCM
jgi:hypothetical protein